MSEVIYDKDNYEKIFSMIENSLAKDGKCIMANKYFYFGVGGSVPEFTEWCEKNHP